MSHAQICVDLPCFGSPLLISVIFCTICTTLNFDPSDVNPGDRIKITFFVHGCKVSGKAQSLRKWDLSIINSPRAHGPHQGGDQAEFETLLVSYHHHRRPFPSVSPTSLPLCPPSPFMVRHVHATHLEFQCSASAGQRKRQADASTTRRECLRRVFMVFDGPVSFNWC